MNKIITLIFLLSFLVNFTFAQSVTPQKVSGNKYSISCANIYFEVDADFGSRITSFKADNTEILNTIATDPNQRGSTFWPSPQSVWNWPPLVNLDSKPYSVLIKGDKITFKGQIDASTQLRFYKTMYANVEDTSITIEYVIKNEKTTIQKWAPWEVTRVKATGLTVFSKESGSVTGDMASRTTENNGYIWYDQDTKNSPGTKFYCDGKGWLAHVTSDDILLLKKFPNITALQAAPSPENEIEVYTIGNDSYTELENQGAYVNIPAKDSMTWKVKWYARALPASVISQVGSQSLTNYIQKILSRSTNTATINLQDSEQFKVYPNPATTSISVLSDEKYAENVQIKISTLEGNVVIINSIKNKIENIAISKLTPGYYLYSIVAENKAIANGRLLVVR